MTQKGSHRENELRDEAPFFAKVARYAAIGIEFPSTVIGGLFLGYLLDLYLNTFPWFSMAMTFLAFVGAVVRLIHWLQRFSSEGK